MKPQFFASPEKFRAWLEANHASKQELWVGFYKRESGVASITWPDSVDAALCFGWIDGIRRSIDGCSYMIRFTPRRQRSKWSAVNLRRVEELKSMGLMHEAGLRVLAGRMTELPAGYAYEQRHLITLEPAQQKLFRSNKSAWGFFEKQAKWYRKTALWWVTSAKQEETRARRLKQLIADSEAQTFIKHLDRSRLPSAQKKRAQADKA